MRTFRLPLALVVTIILSCLCCSAQDFSNKGKEFWLAYCYHVGMVNPGGPPIMTLYITSDLATNYTVEIYGGPVLQSGSIAAGQVITATIPSAYFINDEGFFNNRAIHVTADKPVVVYSYITRSEASGATLCLPTQVLGKEYYSWNFTQVSNEPNSNSYVTIVAVEDSTTVEITPSANTKDGWLANNVYTINLNKGQIYQVLGVVDANGSSGVDLTATHVRSIASGTGGCKRIAVFSGSGKVRIPESCSYTSSDNLYQQLYPVSSWGKKYLTVPSYDNPYNYYRIAKSNPAAKVYVNGALVPSSSFTSGIWYEFFNNIPNLIEADLPISVAQYFTTQQCDGNGAPYDPDMIVLNPVEQNIDNVTVVSSNLYSPGEQDHHLHVIIPNGGTGKSSFRLDGVPVSGWVTHPSDPNYSYIYLHNVSQGYHTLSSDSGFNALAYGYANAESYGYSAGANVKDLYQFISVQNKYATVNFPAGCKNSPLFLSMTFPYQPTQIHWIFGPALNALGVGDTIINAPAFDSTWVVNGRQLYRYKLPGQYSIAVSGTYPVEVLAQNPTSDGCSGEQQIDYELQVFDPPVADFSFTNNGCFTDSVHFLGTANAGGRSIINYSWNFGDGQLGSGQNPEHLYSSQTSYTIKYSVITDVGCFSDTTEHVISLSAPPVAKFFVSTPACQYGSLMFTDQSTAGPAAAISKWTWNFGDGNPAIVATTNLTQSHVYTSAGAFTASLQLETSSGCKSLLFSQPISVNPKPVAVFNFSNACLPGGTTQFTDQSMIAGGKISQWTWDFGDGTTSAMQNPVHNYSSTGPFNVRLTVTSNNGCTDDSVSVMNKVFAQPLAAFAAPAEVCYGTTINFADQSSAPNNSIAHWSWDFGDGSQSTQQNPAKTYSSPGSYTVTLKIISAAGCASGIVTKNITVDPLPVATFNLSSPQCANQDLTFSDASVAGAGAIVKWNWDFGDGNSSSLSSNNFFTHNYAAAGKYNSTLQVTTDKGCTSSVFSKQVVISPVPVADFVVPGSCLNDPFSTFTDSSNISDSSQNMFLYLWNFGDANASASNPNTSSLRNPRHQYTATGPYSVTETVTSNNGCAATTSKNFFVNGSVPIPSFHLQESTTVCSGDTIHLTDNSLVNPGRVIRIEIYWDYLNDSTLKTVDEDPWPGKIYTQALPEFSSPASKTVTIRYIAYSGQTCVQYIDQQISLMARPSLQFSSIPGVCNNAPAFQITQASIVNGLSGNGTFSGQGVSSTGMLSPSATVPGVDTIQYSYHADNGCTSSIAQAVEIYPVPVVDAGPDKFVLEGGDIALSPVLNANFPVTYTWSPSTWLDNAEALVPKSAPHDDIIYMLTVTSDKGCSSSDTVLVKVLKTPRIPNIFSPNNDGIHDKWEIPYLSSYPGCTVDIYNRYGQLVFHSIGYDRPWDGTVNGNPVPVGTYYYVIDPKHGRQKMAGYVDVIR